MTQVYQPDTAYDIKISREFVGGAKRVVEKCLWLWGKEKPPLLIDDRRDGFR